MSTPSTPRRRAYRLGLLSGISLALVAAAGLALGPVNRTPPAAAPAPEGSLGQDDVAKVTAMLAGVRGAAPLTCEMTARNLRGNFWDRGMEPVADPEVRALANWAGRDIEDPAVVPILRPALADPDQCVRRIAARLLGRTEAPEAAVALLDSFRSSDSTVREMAALGLGVGEPREALDPLLAAVRSDPARGVRLMAVWAVGELEQARAVEPLLRVLTDRDPAFRRAAASALGEIEDQAAVPGLVRALDDGNAEVRLMVAWALGVIEDGRAVPGLTRVLLGDSDPRVRVAAAGALGDILD